MMNTNIKIALLLGGTSPEKEVSRNTAKSILKALRELGFQVIPMNPAYGINQPADEEKLFDTEEYAEPTNRKYIELINSKIFDDIDLAFLALHGKWGEDGTIQSLLELRGIKYTGSGVLSSSLAMDKAMTKVILQHSGVPTPAWIVVDQADKINYDISKKIGENLGYPCVIKPNDQGSTVGLTICKDETEVKSAIELALQFSDKALIEQYIPGRELTVAVLDEKALPILEIRPKNGFYDYENKYTAGRTEYIVPAEIPNEITIAIQEKALIAFKSVGCKTYSRIDFRLTDEGNSYCLEINTLPGMTSLSLVPKAAKAAGISFEELIARIVKNAIG